MEHTHQREYISKYIFIPNKSILLACILTFIFLGCQSNHINSIPKEIEEKNRVTIEKVDEWIVVKKLDSSGGITSDSKNFDLNVYLKTLEIGVIPYLEDDNPLKKEVVSLIKDIHDYSK